MSNIPAEKILELVDRHTESNKAVIELSNSNCLSIMVEFGEFLNAANDIAGKELGRRLKREENNVLLDHFGDLLVESTQKHAGLEDVSDEAYQKQMELIKELMGIRNNLGPITESDMDRYEEILEGVEYVEQRMGYITGNLVPEITTALNDNIARNIFNDLDYTVEGNDPFDKMDMFIRDILDEFNQPDGEDKEQIPAI